MKRVVCCLILSISAMAFAQTKDEIMGCCQKFRSFGRVTDDCKTSLTDPDGCAALFEKMKHDIEVGRAEAMADYSKRKSRELIFNILKGVVLIGAFMGLVWRKRKKGLQQRATAPKPKPKNPPPGNGPRLGSYE